MTNLKRNTVNAAAAIALTLFVVGLVNMSAIVPAVEYANAHLSIPIAIVFYSSIVLTFFLLPIVGGVAMECRLWDSGSRVGMVCANVVASARNRIDSLIALGVLGGAMSFVAFWGLVTVAG